MRRKANATDRHPIPTASSGRTRQEKFLALLQAGYRELGSQARRLEREFVRLDAESLRHIEQPSIKTASLRGSLQGIKIGEIRETRDRL